MVRGTTQPPASPEAASQENPASGSIQNSAPFVPELPEDVDNLAAALAYARAGLYVLPVSDSKKPGSVVGNGWPAKSSRDPQQIAAWFAGTGYGIALHCGRSGLVVLDVDQPDRVPDVLARHLSTAPYQSTRPDVPGRGHYLFGVPPARVLGNGLGQLGGGWGEIRGANGVVMLAPSAHRDGGRYAWVRTAAVPTLPDELAALLPNGADAESTVSDATAKAFLVAHNGNERPELLEGHLNRLRNQFAAGESRHASTVSPLAGAMKEAAAGYYPAETAAAAIRALFVAEVGKPPASLKQSAPRVGGAAAEEFRGLLCWAVAQALAADVAEVRARVEDKVPDRMAWMNEIAPPAPAGAVLHSGQVRMAYRLADSHAGRLLFVHGLGWHRWDGVRWSLDDDGEARRAVIDVLRVALAQSLGDKALGRDVRKCESAAGIAGVLDVAGNLPAFACSVRAIDADPFVVNTAGGTLDLHTLALRRHAPADRLTKVTRGNYRPDARSALWELFLARVLPDPAVRAFVQRLVGVGLIGEVREHVLAILTGTGANGKTVFDRAIRNAFGDYAITAEPDLFMHREGAHPTGEMDLRGVRWVVVSESEKDRRLAEATMKRLTGGDTIRARRMRRDFVEFTPSHTAVLITNHLPRVSGDDAAIWRRLRVVPFDVVIPEAEQDRGLGARLELEADAIVTWAVEGYRDYRARGLDAPPAVRAATAEYQRRSDAVGRFIAERCTTTSAALKATTAQLFDAWEIWRAREGAEMLSKPAFGQALDAKGYPVTSRTTDGRWRDGIALSCGNENL